MTLGVEDKLYWRFVGRVSHCFKKLAGEPGYMSLCDRHERPRAGGQSCSRPPPPLRCGMCDGREMDRRKKDESLPESADWAERNGLSRG